MLLVRHCSALPHVSALLLISAGWQPAGRLEILAGRLYPA
jgi:hypothetical protein